MCLSCMSRLGCGGRMQGWAAAGTSHLPDRPQKVCLTVPRQASRAGWPLRSAESWGENMTCVFQPTQPRTPLWSYSVVVAVGTGLRRTCTGCCPVKDLSAFVLSALWGTLLTSLWSYSVVVLSALGWGAPVQVFAPAESYSVLVMSLLCGSTLLTRLCGYSVVVLSALGWGTPVQVFAPIESYSVLVMSLLCGSTLLTRLCGYSVGCAVSAGLRHTCTGFCPNREL